MAQGPSQSSPYTPWVNFFYVTFALILGAYFCFAAIQGNYGVLRRGEVLAEKQALEAQLQQLRTDVAIMENKTQRLSDEYLDLDLLDQQARDVLGMIRRDEIVIE